MIICYLLDIIYAVILLILSPWLLYRVLFQRRYRSGWGQRFGAVPRRYSHQPCIWIHAVSMGEINAIGTLVKMLGQVLPQFEIVISSTTDTGIARAKSLYGQAHRVFFYPWDFTFAVKRAFNRIRPDLCILMELEVWHNFTAIAARRSIPVMVANGRISSGKGFPRYRRIAPLVRPMFRRLSLVLAQDETYGRRFEILGASADRVKVAGSLKYDTADTCDSVAGAAELERKLGLSGESRVLVAGSTGDGEEAIVLESFDKLLQNKEFKSLRLVVVPRKPERFDEVARLIESRGYRLVRYSRVKAGEYTAGPEDGQAVILGDTMGDLRKFYSLAAVIFVGRSLVPMGGSDMMEAAGLGKPVVVGPYTENFAETMDHLVQGGGIEVAADGGELTGKMTTLLSDKEFAAELGRRGRQVILDNQGATRKTVEAICEVLGYQMPLAAGGIATRKPIEMEFRPNVRRP
ncbi:MAG: 3-deoxy-D-manno-octulosonic acid transferase [Planctomycetes bacterium ADurb.Bin412]|nr:MAG: 3-deoxy-D-manno-octulosonic acid transferase [Planctomycetes bacterium ADurb.Bin412]